MRSLFSHRDAMLNVNLKKNTWTEFPYPIWFYISEYYDVDSSTSDEAFSIVGRQSNHYSYSSQYSPHSSSHYIPSGNWTEVGISPPVLNLATKAIIEVNATCGERSPETYCKLVEHAYRRNNGGLLGRTSQCQVCDAHSSVRLELETSYYVYWQADRD